MGTKELVVISELVLDGDCGVGVLASSLHLQYATGVVRTLACGRPVVVFGLFFAAATKGLFMGINLLPITPAQGRVRWDRLFLPRHFDSWGIEGGITPRGRAVTFWAIKELNSRV